MRHRFQLTLYPSSFSSIVNPNIAYTGGRMYMPGRLLSFKEYVPGFLLSFKEYVPGFNDDEALRIILNKNRFTEDADLFVAEVIGHIDERYIDEFINFPPIFRNIDITTNEQTIGSFMYDYLKRNNFPVDKKERKLTQLMEITEYTLHNSWR